MSGDNFTDEGLKARVVLGDVTNQVKRRFSIVTGDSGLKSEDWNGKDGEADLFFAKRMCLGVENLVKEKCVTKLEGDDCGDKGLSAPTVFTTQELQEIVAFGISHRPQEIKEASNLLVDGGVDFGKTDAAEDGDASRDSCGSSGSMTLSDDEGKPASNVTLSGLAQEGFVSHPYTSYGKEFDVDQSSSYKSGTVEWSSLSKSQGSKSFKLGKCTSAKNDVCVNMNAGDDLLKTCSCSLCLKAAYIWSDLYYQDVKGRVSALKRSQKEASILVNKYARGTQTDTHVQGTSSKSSKLESDLTGQWRFLFRNMEDIFAHECSQLQASFVNLKDLRENCKIDLEKTNGMPSKKY